MASAIHAAGMEPWDITMSDLLHGRASLDSFQGARQFRPLVCDVSGCMCSSVSPACCLIRSHKTCVCPGSWFTFYHTVSCNSKHRTVSVCDLPSQALCSSVASAMQTCWRAQRAGLAPFGTTAACGPASRRSTHVLTHGAWPFHAPLCILARRLHMAVSHHHGRSGLSLSNAHLSLILEGQLHLLWPHYFPCQPAS